MPKIKIPWNWLKQTPIGSKGLIPGVGMEYQHNPTTKTEMENIRVLNGESAFIIVSLGNGKWTNSREVYIGKNSHNELKGI